MVAIGIGGKSALIRVSRQRALFVTNRCQRGKRVDVGLQMSITNLKYAISYTGPHTTENKSVGFQGLLTVSQPHTKSAKSGGWESLRGGTPSPVDFLGSGHYGPRGLHQPPDRKDECVRDSPARPDVRRRTQQEHSREPRGDRRELSHTEGARLATPPSFFGCQKHPCFKAAPSGSWRLGSDPGGNANARKVSISIRHHSSLAPNPSEVPAGRPSAPSSAPNAAAAVTKNARKSTGPPVSFSRDPPPRPRPFRSRYPPALPTRSQAT